MGVATANGLSREGLQYGSGVTGSANEVATAARQSAQNRGGANSNGSLRPSVAGDPKLRKASSGSIFADYNKTSEAWTTHELVEISPVFNLIHVPWWVGIAAAFGQGMSSASGPY